MGRNSIDQLKPVTTESLLALLDDERFIQSEKVEKSAWQEAVDDTREAIETIDVFLVFNPEKPKASRQIFAPMKAQMRDANLEIVQRWGDHAVKQVREQMNARLRIAPTLMGMPGLAKFVERLHGGEASLDISEFVAAGGAEADFINEMQKLVARFGRGHEHIQVAWSYIGGFLTTQCTLPLHLRLGLDLELKSVSYDTDVDVVRLAQEMIEGRIAELNVKVEEVLVEVARLKNAARVAAGLIAEVVDSRGLGVQVPEAKIINPKTVKAGVGRGNGVDRVPTRAFVAPEGFDASLHIPNLAALADMNGEFVYVVVNPENIEILRGLPVQKRVDNIRLGDIYQFTVNVGTKAPLAIGLRSMSKPYKVDLIRSDARVISLMLLREMPSSEAFVMA